MSTLLLNGFVMGLSWDGLPSLAPTVLLNSDQTLIFLFAYLISTMTIMAIASGIIGEASFLLSASLFQRKRRRVRKGFLIALPY